MRRVSISIAVVLATLTSCGVLADNNAAVVDGNGVSTDVVDALARDEVFSQVLQFDPASGESVLPGSTARTALGFAVQAEALVAEARRWGLEVEPDPAALDEELTGAGIDPAELSPEATETAALYLGALQALGERFSELSEPTEADLRLIYDGAPSLWNRTCALMIGMAADLAPDVESALEDGVDIADVPDAVEGVQLAANPEEGCLTTSQLPTGLRTAVGDATIDEVTGPVIVDVDGRKDAYAFVVSSREFIDYDTAQPQLEQLAEALATQGPQAWIGFVMVDTITVNPRYGTGIVLGANGSPTIGRPLSPIPLPTAPPTEDSVPTETAPTETVPTDTVPTDTVPPGTP